MRRGGLLLILVVIAFALYWSDVISVRVNVPKPFSVEATAFWQEKKPDALPQGLAIWVELAPPARQRSSLGSGFIASSDGYVVTNFHVVREAGEIIVRLADQSEHKA